MNKKGLLGITLIDHILFFTLIIVPFLLIYFIFLVSINETVEQTTSTIFPSLETHVYEQRLLNSPHCFALEKNGRVYAGVIDIDKLNQSRLAACTGFLTPNDRALEIIIDLDNGTSLILESPNIVPDTHRSTIDINLVPVTVYGEGPKLMRFRHLR